MNEMDKTKSIGNTTAQYLELKEKTKSKTLIDLTGEKRKVFGKRLQYKFH